MGYTPNVVDGNIILASWGNEVRDRTRQVFATAAERDAQWAAPPNGAECVTLDTGTTWYRLAGAWRVGNDPYLFSFKVYQAGTGVNVPGNAQFTLVGFDSEDWDPSNSFAANRFTAPVPGVYAWQSVVAMVSQNNPQRWVLSLHKNGGEAERGTDLQIRNAAATDEFNLMGSGTVRLAAGDYMDIRVLNAGGNPTPIAASPFGAQRCWFSGFLVR